MFMFLTAVGIVFVIVRQVIEGQKIASLEEEIQKLWQSVQRLQQKTPNEIPSAIPASMPESTAPTIQIPATPPPALTEKVEPRIDSPLPPPARPQTPTPEPPPASIDWEKFTGVNLFSWIGGFALFLGAVFFVKYSIDHGLLSPSVRILLGLALGTGSILGAFLMREKGYAITVHTLSAAGIGILYADIFAAHTLYHFIEAPLAFPFMSLVTLLAFLLAVRLDTRYVAILGLVGGFLTPPLLSTGEDHPFGLFAYVALLDLGLAAVALRKRWGFLVAMGAIGTLLMQIGWVERFFNPSKVESAMAIFLFFSFFFIGIDWLAKRRNAEDEWTFKPAAIMPLIAMLSTGYFMSYPALAARPALLFAFLFLLDAGISGFTLRRDDFRKVQLAAGAISFLLLSVWTAGSLTEDLLPWALFFYLFFAALHAALPVALQKVRPSTSPWIWGSLYPLLMLIPIMISIARAITSPFLIWPAVFLIDLIAVVVAILGGMLWVLFGAVIVTTILSGLWLAQLTDIGSLSGLLFVIAFFSIGFYLLGLYFLRQRNQPSPSADSKAGWPMGANTLSLLPALSAILPYLLLIMASVHLPIESPGSLFGMGALFALLLLGLVVYYRVEMPSLIAMGAALLLQYTWHFSRYEPSSHPLVPLPWYLIYFSFFGIFPFLFQKRMRDLLLPWVAAACVGPGSFYLVYRVTVSSFGEAAIGLLPALYAMIYLAGLYDIRRDIPKEAPHRLTQLALFAGVSLFFISLIFPLQFEKEWLTLGWALEGAALVWLYRRIPHGGLKVWGTALLLIVFVRLALNPAVLDYHPRAAAPILNWYLYTYGITAICFFGAARLWRPQDEAVSGKPIAPTLAGLGVILSFLLLNIEIADFFSSGPTLTFQFSGSFALDLTYTLGWALFGLTLLVVGIRTNQRGGRLGGVGLLAITTLKLFLHDLWLLGQLYRVGAFLGLAAVLILASFLYQRYLLRQDKPEARS